MREKARIERILQKLQLIWNSMPDLRFTQLLSNLFGSDNLNYYLEDIKFEKFLDDIIKDNNL